VDSRRTPTDADPNSEPDAECDLNGELRTVIEDFTSRPQRDPVTKRFVKGHTVAGKTLARSTQFWSAVEPLKRDLLERVHGDLALDDEATQTLRGLVDAYAEVSLFRRSMFLRLVDQGGPITTRGKTRGLYRAYLNALDHEMRLAQVLGLERRTKRVPTLQEVMTDTP
jgi:hypothetical protein